MVGLDRYGSAFVLFVAAAGCSGGGGGPVTFPDEFRTVDGSNNNVSNPDWGQAGTTMARLTTVEYGDGTGSPAGAGRPSARLVSNLSAAQSGPMPSADGLSDLFWQWGQFLDHDIVLTPTIVPAEPFDIAVPTGDPFFDPMSTGTEVIPLDRSFYVMAGGIRQQVNNISSLIDASNVYGSDGVRAAALRTLDGTGRLKMSARGLLPFNEDGLPNAPSPSPSFFLAGDFRANEQVGLTAMHTLFVREHNYRAARIRAREPGLTGEEIYQRARIIVAAEMQVITYREFLPILLGPNALGTYGGYDSSVTPAISNIFAAAAYRFGHTMLSSELFRLDAMLNPISQGHIALLNAFFNPTEIIDIGIEPYLRGQAWHVAQEVDSFVVDDVRNFLFGPPGSGGFDLAALNIQRGRDHGLPDYNQSRVDFGLPPVSSFAEITSNMVVQQNLQDAYGTVDDIDLWTGGLAEDHVAGAVVGETFWAILREQFLALRDGDRFWYENYLTGGLLRDVESQTLSAIIRRNTAVGDELPQNVFIVGG